MKMPANTPAVVVESYDRAALAIELLIDRRNDDVHDLVAAIPTQGERDALLAASLLICAEVLLEVAGGRDQAVALLHHIRGVTQP